METELDSDSDSFQDTEVSYTSHPPGPKGKKRAESEIDGLRPLPECVPPKFSHESFEERDICFPFAILPGLSGNWNNQIILGVAADVLNSSMLSTGSQACGRSLYGIIWSPVFDGYLPRTSILIPKSVQNDCNAGGKYLLPSHTLINPASMISANLVNPRSRA